MLAFDIISLFPQMFQALDYGITARAKKQGYYRLGLINPRDFTSDRHKTVDDRPYGGGPGMLMKYQPLKAAIDYARQHNQIAGGKNNANEQHTKTKVIYLSPQGKPLTHQYAQALSREQHLILLCGRYEGIDERLLQTEIDEECSIGDFVLSGGELAAMALIDAVIRLIPGALGDEESAQYDSFSEGLLDFPQYTRPEQINGLRVPPVLLSGDHQRINAWREYQALKKTWQKRPDLLDKLSLTEDQIRLLEQIKAGCSRDSE